VIKPLAGFRRSKAYEFAEDVAKVWLLWSIIRAVRGFTISFTAAWADIRTIPNLIEGSAGQVQGDVIGPWFLAASIIVVLALALFIRPSTS
jgi:hypothetical protein